MVQIGKEWEPISSSLGPLKSQRDILMDIGFMGLGASRGKLNGEAGLIQTPVR